MSLHAFVFIRQPKKEHFGNEFLDIFFFFFFFQIGAQYTLLPPIIVSFGVIRKILCSFT